MTLRYQRAFALASLGRTDEARSIVSVPPDTSLENYDEGWVTRLQGSIALLLGDYDAAVAKLTVAKQKIDGQRAAYREPTILTHLGLAHVERGEHAEALASLSRAQELNESLRIRMNPTYADLLTGMGRAYIGLRSPAAALAPLERADAFWRGFEAENVSGGPAAFWLSRAYALTGRKAESEVALARARALLVHSPLPSESRLLTLR